MITVKDVASYILNKKDSMPAMKLQKLVYYCQAWSLVWDERELFSERIEAWANGPVCRELFECHKGKFMISPQSIPSENIQSFIAAQQETMDAVLNFYGHRNSQWLSDLTHMEEPWIKARERAGLSDQERGTAEITHEDMYNYYSSIQGNSVR